jgi:adenosylcobinamide-phosphate synthase
LNRCSLIPAAWLLDQLAGDPEWLPHPVHLIGFATARGEVALRRANQSELSELLSGGALSLAVVAIIYYATRQFIRLANRLSPAGGNSVELLLAWNCLAARNLEEEATSVVDAIYTGDLPLARHRLARIVGRNTQHLDTQEICRALIETLAESASDGILAPLFYMALGGVPLAMAYKAVNTLDSMIGHADGGYFYFGKAAARLDDVVNYLPARLTAAAIVAASQFHEHCDPVAAWQTWRRDGDKHKSPNANSFPCMAANYDRSPSAHDHVPTVLQAEYYAQRASAGLIIAEATAISSEGFGWAIHQDCGHRSRSADGDASRMPFMQPAAASLHNSGTRERSRILNYGMARSLYPHRTSIQSSSRSREREGSRP